MSRFFLTFAFCVSVFSVYENAYSLSIAASSASVRQQSFTGSLAWNGEVGEYLYIPADGTYRVTVRAAGQLAGGIGPLMALRINQSSYQTVSVNTTTYADYTFDVALRDGVHLIGVAFTNDALISGQDRNLLLDTITVSPINGGGEPTLSTAADWNAWAPTRDADVLATTNALIEENRKSPAQVMVVDPNGNPVPGVTVTVNQGKGEFLFGANLFGYDAFSSSTLNDTYKQRFSDACNYATIPFYWAWMEPVAGFPMYALIDAMVWWAGTRNITMKGHAVLYGEADMIPAWAGTVPSESVQLQRVSSILSRYGSSIRIWDLVNEPLSAQVPMAFASASSLAKSLQPGNTLIANEYGQFYNGFDIFYANAYQTLREWVPAQRAAGVPIDVVGFEAHEPLDTAWPLEHVWNHLNLYAALGTDIHITEFTVCSNGNPVLGSPYRGTWTEATQGQYVEDFYRVAFAHPKVKAISGWDLSDNGAWLPYGGLLRSDMNPKPAYEKLKQLVTSEWRTNTGGASDSSGRFLFRGFHGDYNVKATYNGVDYTATMKVSKDGANAVSLTVPAASVPDTTAPVIALSGNALVTVAVGAAYSDAGATASDNRDGDISNRIVVSGSVNTLVVGSYTLTYTVSDLAGNAATPVTRTVSVVDTVKPVITLLGSSSMSLMAGGTFTDPGATASDNYDGDISARIVRTGSVNTGAAGVHTLTYNVSDYAGNAALPLTRTVTVTAPDTTKPVITLLGSTPVTVNVFGTYTDAGATATDNVDGTITNRIVKTSTVNANVVGTYSVTYTVSDLAGNAATPVVRTVKVVDTVKPVITMLGSASISIKRGSTYTDAGATAVDNYDGNITSKITATSTVNTGATGTYTVKYNVKDTSNNAASTVTRTVKVVR